MKAFLKSAVFTCSLVCTSAQANLIHFFDFMGNNQGVADSFSFEQGGVQLDVTAWITNVDDDQNEILPWQQVTSATHGSDTGVYKGSTGFGVVSNDNDGSDLDGGSSTDLLDLDEGILFSFSERVNFLGFAAYDLGRDDDINFAVVDVVAPGQLQLNHVFIDESGSSRYDAFPMFPGIQGQYFMAWVDGNDDDVRIADLAFTTIPEPSTFLLLSLAGLMFWRQRVSK